MAGVVATGRGWQRGQVDSIKILMIMNEFYLTQSFSSTSFQRDIA
jgi:hypothetical protein